MKKGIIAGKEAYKAGLGKTALKLFGSIVVAGTALTYLVDKVYSIAAKDKEKEEKTEKEEETENVE